MYGHPHKASMAKRRLARDSGQFAIRRLAKRGRSERHTQTCDATAAASLKYALFFLTECFYEEDFVRPGLTGGGGYRRVLLEAASR